MPWSETTTMDLKEQFIRDWHKHRFTVSELCANYGVSRNKWISRYIEQGPDGLLERSRANHHVHNRTDPTVLCGGAINSPQLLMLSGIGPSVELRKHNIPVVVDLPGVGQNLQDHLDITVMIRETSGSAISLSPAAWPRILVDGFRFLIQRRGVLTSNASQAGGFLALEGESTDIPGIQLHFIPSFLRDHGRELIPRYGCTIHACQLRPKSRGGRAAQCRSIGPAAHPTQLSEPS